MASTTHNITRNTTKTAKPKDPPQLWPENTPIDQLPGVWTVAHTKPRQEKALARDILSSGGAYFVPMYESVRRSGRRQWKSTLPLFPGYVFLCFADDDSRLQALKTNRIVRFIDILDQKQFVREISAIRILMASPLAIDPYKSLKKGVRCRVRSGPMQGIEGSVDRRSGKTRFVIDISILGQGASVEIDADLLEPAE